jgi:hypothetical protein
MSANLEKTIQEEVHTLTAEQQKQVMHFVESLKHDFDKGNDRENSSSVGIEGEGNGGNSGVNEKPADEQLALAAKALLADYQTDRDLTAFTSLDGEDFRHA